MNQLIATAERYSFSAQELSKQLLEHIQHGKVGHWEHQYENRLADQEQAMTWNLAVANGQILYSDNRLWSAQSLIRLVYRYVVSTRNELVKPRFEQLKQAVTEQSLTSAELLVEMKKIGIVNDDQLLKALKIKVLNDLDLYLPMGNGNARFIADRELVTQLPLAGFAAKILLDEAQLRRSSWEKLQTQIPSMNLVPTINHQAFAKANLPGGQQQRIENLVKSQSTLNSIAEEMAKDPLEIAEMFARLGKAGLVSFQAPKKTTPAPIMAIDDSPLILSQFQHWVGGLGYPVVVCQQSETALAQIVEVEPAMIFIDINMPGISGFELVKQIRKQPQLAAIPLVILTGEQKLSNRWRAQWSGCEFLSKPLASADITDFQARLSELLLKLVGTAPAQSTADYSQN